MVYFLIPVYNEEDSIAELSETLKAILPEEKKSYVFVNDCSTDGTVTLLEKIFEPGQLTVLTNEKNSGPGYSFNAGFEYIISVSKNDNDLIVTMEGDNTSDPSILPVMYSLARDWNYDLVLASVYSQGGGFMKTSWIRKIMSFIANQVFRFVFEIKVLTLSSFYRIYSISMVKKINFRYQKIISENGFICMLEILIKAIKSNGRIIEVPMILKSDKRVGQSKMKIFRTSFRYLQFLLTCKL